MESERKSTAADQSSRNVAVEAGPPDDGRVPLADLESDEVHYEDAGAMPLSRSETNAEADSGEAPSALPLSSEGTPEVTNVESPSEGSLSEASSPVGGPPISAPEQPSAGELSAVTSDTSEPASSTDLSNQSAPAIEDSVALEPTQARRHSAAAPSATGVREPEAATTRRRDPLDEMPALQRSHAPHPAPQFKRTGHPVRDRLLAKASEAHTSSAREVHGPTVDATSAFSALSGIEEELEQLAAPRNKMLSEPIRVGRAVLSPTTTLVGVTLIGMAALVSLFMLLVEFAPRQPGASSPSPAPAPHPSSAIGQPDLVPSGSGVAPTAPPAREKVEGPWRIGSAATGQRLIRGNIGQNPFLKAIQEAGLDKSQAYRVFGALKEHKNLDRCRPKDEFIALLDRSDGRVIAFEYVVSREEVYQARENDEGKLLGKQLDLQVDARQVSGSLRIESSFSQAATTAGLEPSIGVVVNRALQGHTSVSQFKPGDRLRIVAQEVTVLGDFYRYAGIEALEYLPSDGSPIRVYYHPTKKRYYDAKGRAPGEGGWRRPVRNAPITSKFNPQRLHPILKKRMPHNGTDFGAPTGTPVYAASYGKVTKLGNYGANGNFIAIEHPNGYETGYSHLSRFEPGLKVGDQVKRAQPIGYVGSTGRSTGPHLHFSAKKNGAFIDPESLKLDALTVLPSSDRAAFSAIREKYDGLLDAVPLAPAASPPETTLVAAAGDSISTPPQEPARAESEPSPQPLPPLQPAERIPATSTPPSGAFYLTDQELLQAQPAVDDGEVEE